MKKIMYLCLAACLCTTLAFAQKVTNKDLQGNWKMTGFTTQGITLDLKTQEVTISPELQAQLSPEAVTGIREGMKQAVEPLSASFLNFQGSTMKLAVGPQADTGDFTLTEKDGKQSLAFKRPDGSISNLPVMMKDKQLYLTLSEQGQTADFIFRKE